MPIVSYLTMHPRTNSNPMLRKTALLSLLAVVAGTPSPVYARDNPDGAKLFARENLVAWCIVPFDAKKRGPAERVAMLKKLGFKKDFGTEPTAMFELATAPTWRGRLARAAFDARDRLRQLRAGSAKQS